MMDINVNAAVVFAEVYRRLAADCWIRFQWFDGLVRIHEVQDATKANQPNWGSLTISLEGAMLAGIIEATEPESNNESETQRAIRYVRGLLGDELEKYGVAPHQVRGVARDGDILTNFKVVASSA